VTLGILGGTFDPIHVAHLRIAEEARETLALERVLFVPAAAPPHRRAPGPTPEQRLAMVRLAIASNPRFEALDLELRRAGPSYSVDTLRELGERHPGARLWFVIGSDAFAELDTWHRPEELCGIASFAVARRPGSDDRPLASLVPPSLSNAFRTTAAGLEHASGQQVRALPGAPLEVSATDLRRRVARGASIRYLVPDPVIEYIEKNRLYKEDV
jgi:nicotinate-nucleotide adenylyltransferase